MNDNRFKYLLQAYLDQAATSDEVEELMRLIRKGDDDASLKDIIDEMIANENGGQDMDPQKASETVKAIISAPAQKTVFMPPSGGKWRALAAACVAIMALCSLWWISTTEDTPRDMVTLHTDKSAPTLFRGKQLVNLPDGSIVLLEEESELSYSPSFGKQTREVALVGEAYFDVEHDPSRPFMVLTGKVTTTVLGTSFNVKAYRGQKEIKVTVTRGKVQVSNDQRTFAILTPDKELAVNTITNDYVEKKVASETSDVWKNLYFKLRNVTLEEAAQTLSERYNTKIILVNDKLKKCRISATFLNEEDLQQVIAVVTGVVQAEYTILPDGSIRIDGKGCEKPDQ